VSSRARVAALVFAVLVIGSSQLFRAGYSPDEEFTVFAVRGILADGLPILPSGLLYDRGVAYSYAAWVARVVSGSELPAFRALSLLSAIAALAILFALVRRISSHAAAWIAVVLVGSSIPFWVVATTGRFYAPFLAIYLAALLALSTQRTLSTPRTQRTLSTPGTLGTLGTLALLCRWLHELAFTLAAVPALLFLLAPKGERRVWWRASLAVGIGLVVGQAGLFALHYLAPFSGETMIQRFFLWQVVNLFEAPPDRQFAIMLVVMVIGWLVAPRRAGLITSIALCGVAMLLTFAIARASNAAPMSWALVKAILDEGSRYPLDMFRHLAAATPVTLATALGLLAARLAGAGGEWRAPERAAHLMWIGWVLWFGVIESGITINYLLLPVTFMLAAIAIDLIAITRSAQGSDPSAFLARGQTPLARGSDPDQRVRRGLTPTRLALVVVLVVTGIALDQWRGTGSVAERLDAARPTIAAPGIDEIRETLQPTDRIVCTDELACLLLVGRVDAWLALDDYVRERFQVRMGDENLVGVYAGSPAFNRPGELFSPRAGGKLSERTLIVDVFKDYPIGSSRAWLPRAIEADGLEVRPLLETAQLRVLQVSPPTGIARHGRGSSWRGDSVTDGSR
jgi:hypothetical protein